MMLLFLVIFVGIVVMNGFQDEVIGFGLVVIFIFVINVFFVGFIVQMLIVYDNDVVVLYVIIGVCGIVDRVG